MSGVAEIFKNGNVLDKNGKPVDLNTHCAGKTVGLYFSAHWCPPCRGFTPQLAEFYNKNSKSKNFEVIFISSDQNVEAFNDYYKEMPWLALDFSDRNSKVKTVFK